MKRTLFLGVFLLLLPMLAIAQVPTTVEILQINWNIPIGLCDNQLCPNQYHKVGLDKTLYIFNAIAGKFYVIKPDGMPAKEIDISSVGRLLPTFVVLNNYQVLLERFSGNGTILTVYLLDTTNAIIEEYKAETLPKFIPCDYYPINMNQSFYRLDNERFIGCSQNASADPAKPQSYHIHIINVLQKNIEQTLTFNGYLERSTPGAWLELQVGLDNNIYIQNIRPEINKVAIQNTNGATDWTIPNSSGDDTINIKYDTISHTISRIPVYSVVPARYENNFLEFRTIGIDENGNQYRLLYGGSLPNLMSDLYKISPSNDIIWHISDPAIPTDPIYALLLGENKVLISGRNDRLTLLNVADPIPPTNNSATFTPKRPSATPTPSSP